MNLSKPAKNKSLTHFPSTVDEKGEKGENKLYHNRRTEVIIQGLHNDLFCKSRRGTCRCLTAEPLTETLNTNMEMIQGTRSTQDKWAHCLLDKWAGS